MGGQLLIKIYSRDRKKSVELMKDVSEKFGLRFVRKDKMFLYGKRLKVIGDYYWYNYEGKLDFSDVESYIRSKLSEMNFDDVTISVIELRTVGFVSYSEVDSFE